MNEEKKPDQVSWNLAGATGQEISLHLARASESYRQGKLRECFYTLKLIKNRIIQNLNHEERDELKKVESKISDILTFIKLSTRESEMELGEKRCLRMKKLLKVKPYELLDMVDNYNELIMDLLHKYGFLFQIKDDKTKMVA